MLNLELSLQKNPVLAGSGRPRKACNHCKSQKVFGEYCVAEKKHQVYPKEELMTIRCGAQVSVQSVEDAQEQTTLAFTAISLHKRQMDHLPDRAPFSQVSLRLAQA